MTINSYFHAVSSSKKWGGETADYQAIHNFIDSSKTVIGDARHRSLYHHTMGVMLCRELFGETITTSAGRKVPVREIAERHIIEDLGWLPSPADYLRDMPIGRWMSGKVTRTVPLSTLHLTEETA